MPSPSNSLRRSRPLLGTFVEISATGAGDAFPAIDAAFAAIERVQALMSYHEEASDVARINASPAGCVVDVDADTYGLLEFASRLHRLSRGAFDIATAPALVEVGFLPAPRTRDGAPPTATADDLELLGRNRVRWRREGWIDLGGIAKGYAVDRAVMALIAFGMEDGVVNAGGDLRVFGADQPIHVRHPDHPGSLAYLGEIRDCALATSGGYFSGNAIAGGGSDPLVDPGRGACTTWNMGVSVIARDCMTADALTKVVRLAPESAPGILDRFGAQAVVIEGSSLRTYGSPRLRAASPIAQGVP
jgi:thiamine biosynthesis lipoprotein